jgi:SAM-dependent methyltransferase
LKRLAQRLLGSVGLEVGRAQSWLDSPVNALRPGWEASELMANQHRRPEELSYSAPAAAEDKRLKYVAYFLDVRGWRVLELGPRTGHLSVLLDKMGAREIVGVEGRQENVDLCNRTRDLYGLPASYVRHDVERLASGEEQPSFAPNFDLVFSLGVLYHLADPAPVLAWGRTQAPRLFLGTHYYEPRAKGMYKRPAFTPTLYRGEQAMGFRELGPADAHGGMSPSSIWLSEEQLVGLLHVAGYERVEVLGHDLAFGHPHLTILASA